MQPINYMAGMPQSNPLGNILQGLQAAGMLSNLKNQRIAAEQQQQQAQAQQDRSDQYKTMLSDYMQNPSIDKLTKMQVLFPEQEKAIKPLVEKMDKNQLALEQSTGTQVLSSIKQGDMETANSILDKSIESGNASGIDVSALKTLKQSLETNPKSAIGMTQWMLYHSLSPDQQQKFATAQKTIEETSQSKDIAPLKQKEQEAKTIQEQIKTKYLEPKTILDIQKQGVDVKKIYADIDNTKAATALKVLDAKLAKETNPIKIEKLKLDLDTARQKFQNTANEKAANIASSRQTIDNMLNTTERIFNNKSLDSILGPRAGILPVNMMSSDMADAKALIDTLGSQTFLSQVQSMKGMGALSDAEGAKLTTGLQNLSRQQSPAQFKKNLQEIQRLMQKARKNIATRYGVKDTAPDTPDVQTSPQEIDALLKKYGQ